MSDAAAQITARLAQLWHSSRPGIMERLATLHTSQTRLTENPEDTDARGAGREAAHKLSGVLGVFGLPRGSELASEIEHLLLPGHTLTSDALSALELKIEELDAVIASKTEGPASV